VVYLSDLQEDRKQLLERAQQAKKQVVMSDGTATAH
jgi:hypothetical protein